MAVTSRSAVIEALAGGTPDALLGTAETEWLDFKTAPYALDSDKGKYELCKDVAAFANAHGGLLVCGVQAEKNSQLAQEKAVKLRPFPRDRVDLDRYVDTLNEHLRPRAAVTMHWYAHSSAEPDGDHYLVIEIDPVPESNRYVIVRRIPNDKEKFTEGVTVPIRHGDRTILLTAEEVAQLINDGLRSRTMASSVRSALDNDLEQAADADVNKLGDLQEWDSTPVLFWQSIPPRAGGILPNFHSPNGIRGAFTKQQVLRLSGFNFYDFYEQPQTLAGGLLIGKRGRAAILLRPDGLITAGAAATADMLGWAMQSQPDRLNPFVLTEMTLEYFRLADGVLQPLAPGSWRHRIIARRFAGEHPRTLGKLNGPWFFGAAQPASEDTWEQEWTAIGDPERDAYEALSRLYVLFGLDTEANPYIDEDRVSTDKLLAAATQ